MLACDSSPHLRTHACPATVQCIEDCEERFSEQQIEELLSRVHEHLGSAA